ncbi:MAG: transcriptional regulator [Rickettsiales bacterium]|jgi:HTH-type transcriptional regulator / antitoxin HipB|nr:transcriptional regulator [Rickettsiales bacterium]MDA9573774.1 helix-turn-helix transcriptional regulator [Rickettsiales bacterium]|tara:strand:- start:3784 stop:4014 length:231 start_codon:yes stop_codon:yes gene_type:complete
MDISSKHIGALIKEVRKELNLTQCDVATICGTGLRFIIELENGKPSCQIDKSLYVLQSLGIKIGFSKPICSIQNDY